MTFDFEYLRRTFVEFREKMGSREWMLDETKRERMLGALFYAVNNAQLTPEQDALVQSWWEVSFEEFSRRCVYVDLRLPLES